MIFSFARFISTKQDFKGSGISLVITSHDCGEEIPKKN
jgi:hypothetical protein